MGIKVNQETLQMIADLSNARGASGFEDETVQAAAKHIGEGYTTEEDCLRNFYMYRTANSGNKPVFMLDAHSDEVGFMVHSIRPNGTLRFVALGGWNVGSLASSKVLVRNSEGKYLPGVIAAKPVHFMSASEKASAGAADISSLSIDIGAVSAKDAAENFKIRIGEPVVPDVTLEYDEEHDLMFGKAFDCRIGCAALIETLRRLRDEKLDVDVVGVLSSQEEVGERGMKVAVNHIKPQIAICFEGCPETCAGIRNQAGDLLSHNASKGIDGGGHEAGEGAQDHKANGKGPVCPELSGDQKSQGNEQDHRGDHGAHTA